jgi:hypothetical protein
MARFKKIFEVRNQQAALRALQAEHDAEKRSKGARELSIERLGDPRIDRRLDTPRGDRAAGRLPGS